MIPLQSRHGVSNNWPLECLFNSYSSCHKKSNNCQLFARGIGRFLPLRVSNAESDIFILWVAPINIIIIPLENDNDNNNSKVLMQIDLYRQASAYISILSNNCYMNCVIHVTIFPIGPLSMFTLSCRYMWACVCPKRISCMMMSSNWNILHVTGPLCEESIGDRWVPLTKASDAVHWYFLWLVPEPTIEQIIKTPVIWDAIVFIMTSL